MARVVAAASSRGTPWYYRAMHCLASRAAIMSFRGPGRRERCQRGAGFDTIGPVESVVWKLHGRHGATPAAGMVPRDIASGLQYKDGYGYFSNLAGSPPGGRGRMGSGPPGAFESGSAAGNSGPGCGGAHSGSHRED